MKLEENKRYRLESSEETAPLVFENELYYDSISGLSFHENGTCASAFNRDIISVITDEVAETPLSKEEQDKIGVAEEIPKSKITQENLDIAVEETINFLKSETGKVFLNLNPTDVYPEIGATYKHYKGGHYRVLTMCDHTETGELLVITQSVEFGTVRARPLNIWHSPIVPAQGDTKRFTLVG